VNVRLGTVVENVGKNAEIAAVSWQIVDAAGKTVATAKTVAQTIDVDGKATYEAIAPISDPALWSVEEPNLYTALVTVETHGQVRDAEPSSLACASFALMRTMDSF